MYEKNEERKMQEKNANCKMNENRKKEDKND
jgi:hypothetical protein